MTAATACRYEQGPCTYPTLRRHFKCQDGSCPEQVGRACSRTEEPPTGQIDIRTPAASPPAREEDETMRPGRPPSAKGMCPICGETDVKLKVSPKLKGGTGCNRCYKAAQRKEKREAKKPHVGPSPTMSSGKPSLAPRSAPPHAAPKPPAPAPIVQQRPAPAPAAGFSPLTARSLAEALQVEEVRLLVTCWTAAAVLAVVRAVECDQDVVIGVGAAARQG